MTYEPSGARAFLRSPTALGLIALVAAAGFIVVAEHSDHILEWLPYLLLAACPLMHLFHRHGGRDRHHTEGPRDGRHRR